MDLRGLDLNLLVVLDALLAEKNVTRAGLRVHMSQSATSGALARLRGFFRDALLIQTGRTLVLTPLAQSLVRPVRDIMLQIQATVAVTAVFDPATAERTFRIMGSDYVVTVLMTEVLQRLEREAPGIRLEFRQTSRLHADLLNRGEIDFVMMPDIFVSPDHPRELLFEDTHTCVVWNENPLIGRRLSFEQYLAMGHVCMAFDDGRHHSFEEWFLKNYGYVRRIEVVVPAFTLAPALVVGTRRIATMHTRLARLYAKYLPLRLLPFPIEIPRLAETLQWHKYQDLDPGCLWLRRILRQAADRLGRIEPRKVSARNSSSSREKRRFS
jgi:LysR family transcriptional regulator, nod-box dependent transcriptional activator